MSNYPSPPPEGGPYRHDGSSGPQGPYGGPGAHGAPAYGAPPPQNSGQATTSLVLGIVSVLCLGLLTGIPAIIIARKATKEIDASHGTIGGRGLATAGLVTGIIGTLWSVLMIIAILGMVAVGGNMMVDTGPMR